MAATFALLKRYGGAAKLREAASRSPDVWTQIETELTALKGINPERCVITKEYAAALSQAVAGGDPSPPPTSSRGAGSHTPSTSLQVGDYTILQDRRGGLQIKAKDGTMIPLVGKDNVP